MIQHASISISGLVQGVFFRYHSKEMADRLRLVGWVANRIDGSVQVEVEGERPHIDAFVAWCQHGPSGAHVDSLKTVFSSQIQGYSSFEIRLH
jgi:acylphosphatase